MNSVDAKTLQQLKNLAGFSATSLKKLADNLSVKTAAKNEIIFDQGDDAKLVYLLLAGVAKLSHLSDQETQTIVSLLPAGRFFGLDSLIPQTHYALRCEAFEDCTIGAIKPKTLIELFSGASYETFLSGYVAVFHPARAAYIHCLRGIGVDVRRRLAMELLNLADRFGAVDPRGISITLNLSHELLASIVGASRQRVTEYLNEFDRDRMIFRDGRRIIIAPEKLQKIFKVVANTIKWTAVGDSDSAT
ncbi:MAG TPA: Crp/Fnr family transcriptional regulator [Candidatus Binatia bacterium]|jgi:CRP-like cAMP-binding protein